MTLHGELQSSDKVARAKHSALRVSRPIVRKSSRRSYYAILASEGVVFLPEYKPLGYLKQANLILAAKSGNTTAMQSVWLANARLAFTVVNRYRVHWQDVPDAVQAAQLAFVRAIEGFEIERLNEFSTYAYHWLRNVVQRHRCRTLYFIRIPVHIIEAYHAFRREIVDAPSRAAWFDARAAQLDRDPSQYQLLMRIHGLAEPVSLTPRSLISNESHCPLNRLVDAATSTALHEALDCLADRDRLIIKYRYGLDGLPELTLEEIGGKLNLTRERVRQIQDRTESKLRWMLGHLDQNW